MSPNQIDAVLASDLRVFREARAIIGESLWWDAAGALMWCDIDTGVLHRCPTDGAVDGAADTSILLPPPVAAFQPAADGMIVAGADSVFLIDRHGRRRATLAAVRHARDTVRFNEGKCDPFGGFVVGSMDVAGGDPVGAIYVVREDGSCRTLVDGLGVANGFEWSDDGGRMWFTDTAASTIFVADYDGQNLDHITEFSRGRASDGLVRDSDGGFWNGINDTGRVTHLTAMGEVDFELDIPAGHVTSVGFGGTDRSTLFIATAREKLSEQQLEDQPQTGSIFAIDTTTTGLPVRRFGAR